MLPRLSNVPLSSVVPTSNTTTKLSVSGLAHKGMNVSETQGCQQCVLNDTVVDCGSVKGRTVSDFGVQVATQVFKNGEYPDKPKGSKPVSQERKYKCDQCGQTCVTPSKLERHKIVHTPGRNYKCPDCNMTYRHEGSLNRHKTQEHAPPREPFMCRECGSTFLYKYGLDRHKFVHSREKPHECKICGKGFADRHGVKRHIKIHNKDLGLTH